MHYVSLAVPPPPPPLVTVNKKINHHDPFPHRLTWGTSTSTSHHLRLPVKRCKSKNLGDDYHPGDESPVLSELIEIITVVQISWILQEKQIPPKVAATLKDLKVAPLHPDVMIWINEKASFFSKGVLHYGMAQILSVRNFLSLLKVYDEYYSTSPPYYIYLISCMKLMQVKAFHSVMRVSVLLDTLTERILVTEPSVNDHAKEVLSLMNSQVNRLGEFEMCITSSPNWTEPENKFMEQLLGSFGLKLFLTPTNDAGSLLLLVDNVSALNNYATRLLATSTTLEELGEVYQLAHRANKAFESARECFRYSPLSTETLRKGVTLINAGVRNSWLSWSEARRVIAPLTQRYNIRYVYENIDPAATKDLMAYLVQLSVDEVNRTVEGARSDVPKFIHANEFALRYVAHDGSISKHQGLKYLFADGSQVLFCLVTGSEGPTILLNFKQPKEDPSKTVRDSQDALAPLVEVALILFKMQDLTGASAPKIIP